MKKYPRIHSLSTLGLRHHQAFDYCFHPFRTDFVGDSGCGKSMIADLLQLILVGNDEFVSPTHSTGRRDPSGMVLPHTGRGMGVGYAFLNLEIAARQFVAIGIYLEDTSNAVRHFAVQSGYSEDKPQPFGNPLKVADVIKADRIPSEDELETLLLEDLGLVLIAFKRKAFHRWLYDNSLLSLDLSVSDKTLRDYASIIQSFSRGKMTEITRPESLNAFLFGQEKGKEMWGKFQKAAKDLREAAQHNEWNTRDIADLKAKARDISELAALRNHCDASQKAWLTAACAYTQRHESIAFEELQDLTRNAKDGLIALEVYQRIICKKLEGSEAEALRLQEEYDAAFQAFGPANIHYSQLEKAQRIIAQLGCIPTDLSEKYKRDKSLRSMVELIAELHRALNNPDTFSLFESLLTPEATFVKLINSINCLSEDKAAALEQQRHLLRFADINAQGSLGHWAIAQQATLSREVESMLMYFLPLPMSRQAVPAQGDRAVTAPDVLFHSPKIVTDEATNGFWLQLNGLEEFIPYVDEQRFTKDGLAGIRQRLEALSADARAAADRLEKEVAALESLRTSLDHLARSQEAIAAYQSRQTLETEQPNLLLNFSEEQLAEYEDALQAGSVLEIEYRRLKQAMEAAQSQQIDFKNLMDRLRKTDSHLTGLLEQNRWTAELREIENAVLGDGYYNDADAMQRQTIAEEAYATSHGDFYSEKVTDAQTRTNTHVVTNAWKAHQDFKQKSDNARNAYFNTYGQEYKGTGSGPIDEPAGLKEAFEKAGFAYQGKFDFMVRQYCPSESYKFETTKSYEELCEAILPDVLGRKRPEGESEVEAIDRQLHAIAEKARELNNRKLNRLRELLDEVHSEANNRYTDAKLIDSFLNNKDQEITGGHRARLDSEFSRQYPIQWMRNFADRLYTDQDLFSIEGQSLADLTGGSITLEEKLLDAFWKLGGTRSSEVTAQKLLDPNSYFRLSFSMRSQAGKLNMGSSGQTYTAIAMLCIARLSLVGAQGAANKTPGLRFMPIDEAEGLGTNYDLLHQIAKDYDYQIISMSISPLNGFRRGGQYLYGLRKNFETEEEVNYTPWAVLDDTNELQ